MQSSSTHTGKRDHRVDFFRGVALAMIFINHIPGNFWENMTSRNFGFSDSAELFVFLAGYASAFAYGRPFLGGHRLVVSLKAWRRAGTLYLVHTALTLFAVGFFAWAALIFGDGGILAANDLAPIVTDPLNTLVGLATLGHQLRFVNILPMYVALLVMLPALLALTIAVGRNGMVLGAFLLWAFAALFWLNLPNHPYSGGWFFNPFAWQLIFAIGLNCGLARLSGEQAVPYSRPLYIAALAYLAGSFLFIEFEMWGFERDFGLPVMLSGFDKTYVSLPRLLHLLALVYVFAHAPRESVFSRISADNPFTRLGRHSLPVFATGTALALVVQVVKFGEPPQHLRDTLLIAAGLGLQFGLAHFLDWWRTAGQAIRKPAPIPAAAQPRPVRAAEAMAERAPPDGAGQAGMLTARAFKG
ncbi:OpgC protein [Aureimonas endophytica]|uniref:OpgC protein n=1 Tax=Aureimonas endophytica TaxID=2027858 RepID=A0A917EAW6_9HYPH|nr:OpgC domain-containing protein [Aureimonas endophytica]GGE17175.1 OpgC protein [Aureimonas endophytica]